MSLKIKMHETKKSEDFDMNTAFFQAKKAITDWTKRQGHKTLEWLYTDGRKSPTSYPSGIWDFEWDAGNGMATAELKVSPYETRTNSWNDRMDFSLRVGTEDKPTFYTSVEDVLSALDTLISKTEIKMESKKSEASKFGTGMAKRKDFSKTRNLGEIMDVLEKHRKILKEKSEDMKKSKEDLEASIALLQKFEAAADFLKTQSVKGIKKALALKNSPEVKQAGEVDKALKDALSVIATDLGNIPDVTQLMVVLDSRYATRGSKILTTLEGQVSQAIEVDMASLKKSVEKGEITEDDIMQQVALTSTTHGVKDKDMVTKVTPILERMNAMLDASDKIEEAVIDPKQFAELRDIVQKLVDEASAPKDTIRTTITALDKNTIGSVQKKEAFIGEGVMDTLKNFVKSVKDKIAGLWDSFTSLFFSLEDDALEAAEVFDNIELGFALVGISITESRKAETLGSQFEVLTKSVLHACDVLVKDPSLAGDFDDELIYAEDAVKNAVESFQVLGQACESLKRALSYRMNEDNMAIIGILSDAISQIVADGEGDAAGDAGAEAEEDEESVIDRVERDYAPSPEEGPATEPEGGEAPGEEEPEQF